MRWDRNYAVLGEEYRWIWFLEFGDLYIVHHSEGFVFCSSLSTCRYHSHLSEGKRDMRIKTILPYHITP